MTKSMTSKMIESEIEDFAVELRKQAQFYYAAILDMGLYNAKGYLPDLIELKKLKDEILEQLSQS